MFVEIYYSLRSNTMAECDRIGKRGWVTLSSTLPHSTRIDPKTFITRWSTLGGKYCYHPIITSSLQE